MSSASGPRLAPVTGTLAEVPVAHALVYVRNRRLSGGLDLRTPDGRRGRVTAWRGLVVEAATSPVVARFGAVAYELGFVDAATLDATTRESAHRRVPQADILVERGAITRAQRQATWIEQLRRRVHHLFTFPESTSFAFTESHAGAAEPPLSVDPLAPVWRGICDFPPERRVREVLERVGDAPLAMVSEAALERAELEADERTLCETLLGTPLTLKQLRAASRVPAARLDLLVYLLVISRCVEPVSMGMTSRTIASVDPNGGPRPRSFELPCVPAPRALGPAAVTELRSPVDLGPDGVRAWARQMTRLGPRERLGLPPDATLEAVRAAYVRLARVWNPDKLPPGLEGVRAEVERVYEALATAYRTVVDSSAASGT